MSASFPGAIEGRPLFGAGRRLFLASVESSVVHQATAKYLAACRFRLSLDQQIILLRIEGPVGRGVATHWRCWAACARCLSSSPFKASVQKNTSALSFSTDVLSATLAVAVRLIPTVTVVLILLMVSSTPRPSLPAELETALSLCYTFLALPVGASVPPAPLNSKWFQSYSRAVLESDPNLARIYVTNALDMLNETLNQSLLKENERKAISRAIYYLRLIEHQELRKAS